MWCCRTKLKQNQLQWGAQGGCLVQPMAPWASIRWLGNPEIAEHGVADCDSGVSWVRGDISEVNSLQQISSYVNLPNHISAYVDFWLPQQHEIHCDETVYEELFPFVNSNCDNIVWCLFIFNLKKKRVFSFSFFSMPLILCISSIFLLRQFFSRLKKKKVFCALDPSYCLLL